VRAFLALAFALSWAVDAAVWFSGVRDVALLNALRQLQMLTPALSVILLGLFVWRDSPIYYRANRERPLWFLYFYIAYTALYALLAAGMALWPQTRLTLTDVSSALAAAGLLFAVVLRILGGRQASRNARLNWGAPRHWLLYAGGYLLVLALLLVGNMAFRLGNWVDLAAAQEAGLIPGGSLLLGMAQSVIGASFLGLVLGFGQEYGWRGFLQGELVKAGSVKGVLWVGVFWAAWRWPTELLQQAQRGPAPMWALIYVVSAVLMGFVLGYVMLKAQSVWLAAFVHGLHTQGIQFVNACIYRPLSAVYSFSGGLYGLLVYMLLVIVILLDPAWRGDEDEGLGAADSPSPP
jgi:membrane protease YdiL (CAAX protease family)